MRILIIIIMGLVLNAETKEAYLSLSKELKREIDIQMVALSKQVDNTIDKLALDVSTFAEGRTGLTKTQIKSQLTTLQKESGGMFATATKELTSAVTEKTITISEDIFFGKLKTQADYRKTVDKLTWVAIMVNTCPDCLALHGQSMSMTEWNNTGGVPNSRDTVCTIHGSCKCNLIPSDTMPSESTMREPIKVQSARIRKAEKKRGKSYASSTKKSFLGQINNSDSTIYDLRKVKKV